MITDPWFYAVAIPAMVLIGLSKGGFTVIALLSVPIMSLTVSPVQAAAITLPALVLSDIVAVIAYRGVYDVPTIKTVIPAAIVGVVIGWATASWVTEYEIRLVVGIMSVLFALNYWFRRLPAEPHSPSVWKGSFWGVVTGFTSFVSHAGGPPFQVYAAPLRLPPRILAGTSILTFASINAAKLIPYFALGQFDAANLATSAALLPVAVVTTFVTARYIGRLKPTSYYRWIYLSIFVIGVYLIAESLAEIA